MKKVSRLSLINKLRIIFFFKLTFYDFFLLKAGIYIMQNTMVRGGDGQLGKKIKLGVREKKEKGERKKRGKLH